MSQSKRWCFTHNNPTADSRLVLTTTLSNDNVLYAILGDEVGEQGTPHCQGFVVFKTNKRFNAVRNLLPGCHLEIARGNNKQASDYCKKEANYVEFGQLPPEAPGKRSDWDRFKEWVQQLDHRPTKYELATEWTSLYGRYSSRVLELVEILYQPPSQEIGLPNGWQRELERQLDAEPGNRRIKFVVDERGNTGKSWFVRYFMFKHPKKCQRLSVGKRDDLAHAFDPSVTHLFLDIPRTQLEFLQYSFLESVKDRMVFSPKYDSCCKMLDHDVHVVVFCNEEPDYNKLTNDRYDIFRPFADDEQSDVETVLASP
ncbi:MAG: putative viral replication protein [Taphiavirus pestrotis]|uniref:Putative viral replication protein n=1 Tax=Circoviridae sp. TaxID=1954248 RepID=A0A345MZH3_9VIRU|nr:MAG: putative viral replication protein [Circoviridae sp.]